MIKRFSVFVYCAIHYCIHRNRGIVHKKMKKKFRAGKQEFRERITFLWQIAMSLRKKSYICSQNVSNAIMT